jgi:hypothetical protein
VTKLEDLAVIDLEADVRSLKRVNIKYQRKKNKGYSMLDTLQTNKGFFASEVAV